MGVYIKGMKMPETCIECMNSGLRTAIRCTEWTKISAGLRENHRAISCNLTEVPEPLTDKEQRIFLAAMGREEKVCEEVDRNYVRESYEDSLVRVCKEIRRKVKGALWI